MAEPMSWIQGKISQSAIIHPQAILGSRVEVGPGAIIGPDVRIGDDCQIGPYVVIEGRSQIGKGNIISTGACLGSRPQHLTDQGEDTGLVIGDNNIIREYVTISRGTSQGGGITRVGKNNLIMTNVHIAHDVWVGDEVVLTHGTGLGGHVVVEDKAVIGGLCGIHQYARVGFMAMVGACSLVRLDIPPFFLGAGNPAFMHGVNTVGLRRNGVDKVRRAQIYQAYKILYRSNHRLVEALEILNRDFSGSIEVQQILRFVEGTIRGIARPLMHN